MKKQKNKTYRIKNNKLDRIYLTTRMKIKIKGKHFFQCGKCKRSSSLAWRHTSIRKWRKIKSLNAGCDAIGSSGKWIGQKSWNSSKIYLFLGKMSCHKKPFRALNGTKTTKVFFLGQQIVFGNNFSMKNANKSPTLVLIDGSLIELNFSCKITACKCNMYDDVQSPKISFE